MAQGERGTAPGRGNGAWQAARAPVSEGGAAAPAPTNSSPSGPGKDNPVKMQPRPAASALHGKPVGVVCIQRPRGALGPAPKLRPRLCAFARREPGEPSRSHRGRHPASRSCHFNVDIVLLFYTNGSGREQAGSAHGCQDVPGMQSSSILEN